MADIHETFQEWLRAQVEAELERLESDCISALMLQDYNYLDRLCIVRIEGSAGYITSRIDI